MDEQELVRAAFGMLKFSYAPYSKFNVGAALLSKDGKVYTGCNIENSAFSPSVCAERTALFKAVSEGVCDFEAIAVVGGLGGVVTKVCPPCGVCRQVLSEFCNPDFKVILAKSPTDYEVHTLSEMLPLGFRFAD